MFNNNNFYKDLFDNIPQGIIVCDKFNNIIAVNKYILELTKFNQDELEKKPLSDIIKDDSACITELIDKTGNNIAVNITHKGVNDYHLSIITPISELSSLNQAHLDFVSTVSHELRTPLTSIKGFADTLLSAGDKLDKEQQQKFISIIKSQIDRLARLVENLLTVTKLESRKDRSIYREINFQDFIKEILCKISPKTSDHIINVEIIPDLPKIWVDSDKLEQILINLIDNAVKYSDKNSKINIIGVFSPDNPDFVEIKIQDQGIGIPKEHLNKIFNKFSRIDSPLTRNVQGTGLGLYITKTLVESMGGKIWAESDGKGTTFTILLPIATPEKQACQRFLNEDKR